MDTPVVIELKAFRKRLVKAQKESARSEYDFIGSPCLHAGITDLAAKTFDWYHARNTTNEMRKAMWDNSLAAIDAQIEKAKHD